jgi:DNA-binding transcriptional regulator YhcF (GntR family)
VSSPSAALLHLTCGGTGRGKGCCSYFAVFGGVKVGRGTKRFDSIAFEDRVRPSRGEIRCWLEGLRSATVLNCALWAASGGSYGVSGPEHRTWTVAVDAAEPALRPDTRIDPVGNVSPRLPLPSSRRLAEDLGISRNTVVLAYERLFDEGYLQTQAGVGTFVTKSLPERCITVDAPPNKASERITPVVVKRPRLAFHGQRLRFAEKGAGRPSIDFWYGSSNRRHFPLKAWRKLLVDNLSRTSTNLSDYAVRPAIWNFDRR